MTPQLTPGLLPMSAFAHSEPTAVGLLDLEDPRLRSPTGGNCDGGERDTLVLVRLHGEPLAAVHLDRDCSELHGADLLAALWRDARVAIAAHAQRWDCLWCPEDPRSFSAQLARTPDRCGGERPRRAAASAAVIVCTAGRPIQLERCLRALLAQSGAFEVLVVDNRPGDQSSARVVAQLAGADARLRYVAEPRVGLAVARNRGVAETDAEIVAFTDDDVVVDAGWLSWLLDAFAEQDVGAACGLVLPLELQTEAQKRFERYDGFCKGLARRSFGPATAQARGRLLFPYINGLVGTGNSMAFRRAQLIAAGGFDPALGAGSPVGAGEETCAFCAVIQGGRRIVYEPRALCWHEHRRDLAALTRQVSGYGTSVGAVLTRALMKEPRFYLAAARAPAILFTGGEEGSPRAGASDMVAPRPRELERLRLRAMLTGPLRYAQGRRRARRLGLDGVIDGR
ncbi:MAG TPA: glycosyltransferase family A protein [Solirubrobacteraceae bacterium]|jgi:hypothetical protein